MVSTKSFEWRMVSTPLRPNQVRQAAFKMTKTAANVSFSGYRRDLTTNLSWMTAWRRDKKMVVVNERNEGFPLS